MGMGRSVYVGAYLELTLKQIETRTTGRVCPTHGNIGSVAGFCPQCGEQIIDGVRVAVGPPSIWDIVGDEFDDSFMWSMDSDMPVLISNYNNGTRVKIDDNNPWIDIKTLDWAVDYFAEQFKAEIAHIKKHEGVEQAEVKLGVVQFYS